MLHCWWWSVRREIRRKKVVVVVLLLKDEIGRTVAEIGYHENKRRRYARNVIVVLGGSLRNE